jgi:predicted chitinase
MADAIEKTPIPPTPPANAKAKQGAVAGIAAIIAACDAAGMTSKYAKCALLGIAGVESRWLHTASEDPTYSTRGIMGTWPRIKEADAIKWNNKPNRYSRVEFFGFIYGTSKGKNASIGNYHGRGFIQVTFPEAYKTIGDKLGVDLVATPDLVIQSPEFGGKVMVEYVKWKIKDWEKAQWDPGFFEYLMSKVGGAPAGHPLKRQYYEYFLGGKAAPAPTNKDASTTGIDKTAAEINALSASKRESYLEDRSANFTTQGFCDPEGKYPLRDFMNEPDTNRLARGTIEGTHVNFKDSSRRKKIPIANGGTYDQPESAYNTVYPYNKVFESESGHVLEFDDSPLGERVNLYHKKGTFIEIDPNGSQVNYIVGDGYYITENNGNIFINGTCNLTVSGPMNILCQGDANLEVCGQVDAVFHNNVNMGVALDLNVAVGGDYNILVEGNYNVEVGKTSNIRTIGTMSLESTDALKLKTAKSISLEGGDTSSTAETLMKMSSSFKLETPADFQIKAKTFTLDIETDTKIKTKTLLVEVEETTKIKTKSFQLDTTNETNILTGMFNTTTKLGALQLNSMGTAVINAVGLISNTAPIINLNSGAIPPVVIPPITDKVEPLALLGAPKVPVDFAGNEIKDREKEQVLVDTVLTPAGTYNPNTLNKNVIDSVLNNIGITDAPDIYDTKWNGPVERKTNLSTAGVTDTTALVVPPVDDSHLEGSPNLQPPARHTDAVFKYETDDDWNAPQGLKAKNSIYGTSEYENNGNGAGVAEDSSPATGGTGTGTQLSAEKIAEINNMTDFPYSYKLSTNFTLGMLSQAQGKILKSASLPGGTYSKQQLVANLSALCINVLEKVYNELGPCRQQDPKGIWNINSALRNETGGSFHNKGEACDIQLVTRDIMEHYDLAVKLEKILPYNQVILEYRNGGNSVWIHLSYSMKGSMKLCTTYIDDANVNASGKPASGSNGLHTFYV